MAITEEELIAKTEDYDKEREFAKFKVKMEVTPSQIEMAVHENTYNDARDNPDWLWEIVLAYYKGLKLTEDDYLEEYLDYVHKWENTDE